jgi:hypothetical protein
MNNMVVVADAAAAVWMKLDDYHIHSECSQGWGEEALVHHRERPPLPLVEERNR